MKSIYIIIITILIFTATLYGETDVYHNSNFNRGDVVTVLISDSIASYSLELVNISDTHITGNIFFPLKLSNFDGQAALIGLDSTLKAGVYTLIIIKEGIIESRAEILISENQFKNEDIPLNYDNTTLRTDPDPAIVTEALEIHEIYGTSRKISVLENRSVNYPLKNGVITSWFGDRRKFLYSDGNISRSIHSGTDIAASKGTEIIACHKGRVVFSGYRIITGNSVVIEYLPGVYGVFFHMNKFFVNQGEDVTEDTVVGTLGSTGLATGPHLHWEFRVGGVSVNPDPLMVNGLIDNSLIMSIVSKHTAE
jgi:Peptidase family M23